MSREDRIADIFLRCSGWIAVEFPFGISASYMLSRSMEVTYGLVTGTEFSGSRIDRRLARQWHAAVDRKLEKIDEMEMPRGDYRTQLFYKRLGLSIEEQNKRDARNFLCGAIHKHAKGLMTQEGLTRRDAQRRAIEAQI